MALRETVEAFNAIDNFIETSEREDICDALVSLASRAGLDDDAAVSLIDRHREW